MNASVALEPKTGLETLAKLLGIREIMKPILGDHPDFKHLRLTGGFDYHYIVSMFIDVKGSTNFHKKYSLEQIAVIIQTIVTAATHTCALFGGHIQRLQYDGVFCYFGGKTVPKDEAVKSAMNAATFFSYFIKYELKEIFEIDRFCTDGYQARQCDIYTAHCQYIVGKHISKYIIHAGNPLCCCLCAALHFVISIHLQGFV